MTTTRPQVHVVDMTDAAWCGYVARHPSASPFHHAQWADAVAGCYGLRAFAVVATDARGRVTGGLPVVEVRHAVRRPSWTSLPFTDHCPVLADDAGAAGAVAAGLQAAGAAAGVRAITVRDVVPGTPGTAVAFQHVLALSADPEEVAGRFATSATRRHIKRAARDGVTVRAGTRAEDLTETFYRLQLLTRRRLGVPVQPHRFFARLWDRVIEPGLGTVLLAEHGGQVVAGAVLLHSNRTTVYKYAASDAAQWKLRANHLVCWRAIQDACGRGSVRFDFGRCDLDGEGLRAFKTSWGAEEFPLVYTELGTAAAPRPPHGNGTAMRLTSGILRAAPPWVCRLTGEALYRYVA